VGRAGVDNAEEADTRPRLAGTKATVRWHISLLKGTKFLCYVEAPDEQAAIETAAKEIQDRRGAAGQDRRPAG
jgi:hypothetical protein